MEWVQYGKGTRALYRNTETLEEPFFSSKTGDLHIKLPQIRGRKTFVEYVTISRKELATIIINELFNPIERVKNDTDF